MKDRKMFYGAQRNIFRKAFMLRHNETVAEKILWQKLNKNQLGVRFKRQHPIENFIADFYCHAARLVIEVDGSSHTIQEQRFYDANRSDIMNSYGLKVIRFTNEDVINDIDSVVSIIKIALNEPLA